MVRGQGPYVYDADGTEYVDLVCSWGPLIMGHAHAQVVDAVSAAVARGTSFGAPSVPEVELAEEIVARTPVDQVRLVSSGTEATMSAVRLARGFTGRDLVVQVRRLLPRARGRAARCRRLRARDIRHLQHAGCPRRVDRSDPRPAVQRPARGRAGVREHGDDIACVITEAAAGNMGAVAPVDGFNAGLSRLCRDHAALFVSDEVMTGFRVGRAGYWGIDGAVEGWTPDLMTFGKVMGGGFPAAAFGGREDVMAHLSPVGPVYQAGTLSGNPVATTAGVTTLRLATDDVYSRLDAAASTIMRLAGEALSAAGVPHVMQAAGNLFSAFFVDPAEVPVVRSFDDASRQAQYRFRAFFHAMLDQGVYLPPSAFEAWFVERHPRRPSDRPNRRRPPGSSRRGGRRHP